MKAMSAINAGLSMGAGRFTDERDRTDTARRRHNPNAKTITLGVVRLNYCTYRLNRLDTVICFTQLYVTFVNDNLVCMISRVPI